VQVTGRYDDERPVADQLSQRTQNKGVEPVGRH
jgi:hypothetical protein